ncbi:MAG: CBS domain-containing protein [Rhodospirillales bacterium]|jgi:CBS domain-containing protein|nr:CBS domain-containing protein [Rhodospirillales bacterium]
MNAETILKAKGNMVITTVPETTVAEAVIKMQNEKIGALVVSGDAIEVAGIVTERDILHGLAEHGAALLEKKIGDIMTCEVITANPEDDVDTLMGLMTRHRCRHIPVKAGEALCGVISIGDLVKSRLEEVEREANQLRDYISRG